MANPKKPARAGDAVLQADKANEAASAESPAMAIDKTSPEFKAAVAEAVVDLIPNISEHIAGMMKAARDGRAAPAESDLGDKDFANALALAISNISDQGVGRGKRIDPATLVARAEARERMLKLLVDARAAGDTPVYQLRRKVYLEEQLIDPVYIGADHKQHPVEIEWQGVPSAAMIPANPIAQMIYVEYQASTGTVDKDYERPLMGVTRNGLVIRSGSNGVRPIRDVNAVPPSEKSEMLQTGLKVQHREAAPAGYEGTRVLGTIAPPAMATGMARPGAGRT